MLQDIRVCVLFSVIFTSLRDLFISFAKGNELIRIDGWEMSSLDCQKNFKQ